MCAEASIRGQFLTFASIEDFERIISPIDRPLLFGFEEADYFDVTSGPKEKTLSE